MEAEIACPYIGKPCHVLKGGLSPTPITCLKLIIYRSRLGMVQILPLNYAQSRQSKNGIKATVDQTRELISP